MLRHVLVRFLGHVTGHVYRHVSGHVYRHVSGHVYRHVYGHVYRHVLRHVPMRAPLSVHTFSLVCAAACACAGTAQHSAERRQQAPLPTY